MLELFRIDSYLTTTVDKELHELLNMDSPQVYKDMTNTFYWVHQTAMNDELGGPDPLAKQQW